MTSHRSYLSGRAQLVYLILNVSLGLLPSLAFFAWIERNASLPGLGVYFQWPWISIADQSVFIRSLWNIALFLLFGVSHSVLAQPKIHRYLQSSLPPQALRTVFLICTGVTLTLLMGLWQSTGIILWVVPLSFLELNLLSFSVFWICMAACGMILNYFDSLHFLGFRQLRQSTFELSRTIGNLELKQTGIYRYIRHPIYTYTLLAILVTPMMSLDRALLALATCLI